MPGVTASQNTGTQLALVVQKLDDLLTRFECLRVQFEDFLKGRAALDNRLNIAENKIQEIRLIVDNHKLEIKGLTDAIKELGFTNRILKWILGITSSIAIALMLSLLYFGIALLTGQAVIVRP